MRKRGTQKRRSAHIKAGRFANPTRRIWWGWFKWRKLIAAEILELTIKHPNWLREVLPPVEFP